MEVVLAHDIKQDSNPLNDRKPCSEAENCVALIGWAPGNYLLISSVAELFYTEIDEKD
jgi:hypothetical protein